MLQVKKAAVRQVVVRIKSVQSLVKSKVHPRTKEEIPVGGTNNEKVVDEYIVLQRRIWKGREEQWWIWGTTQESKANDVS